MPKDYEVAVESSLEETPDVRTIRLRFPEGHDFSFSAGQYILVHIPREGGEETKPYSISTLPSELSETNCIELCIKRVEGGFASGYMHSLRPGDRLQVSGPMGRFLFAEPPANDIVFLATGTGVSPLRSMLRRAFEIGAKKEVWLFFGGRTQQDIIWRAEFESLAKQHENFSYMPVLSREHWQGETGYVQDAMKKRLPGFQGKDYYIAGVKPMVEQVVKLLQELGVPAERVHTEKFV